MTLRWAVINNGKWAMCVCPVCGALCKVEFCISCDQKQREQERYVAVQRAVFGTDPFSGESR